jgi:hypothetical protein
VETKKEVIMNGVDFKTWMKVFSQSWVDKNSAVFSNLFSIDSVYYTSPFNPPASGREEIKSSAEKLFKDQSNLKFNYEILSFENNAGICRCWCRYFSIHKENLIKLDGIFFCRFDKNNLCNSFNSWWNKEAEIS